MSQCPYGIGFNNDGKAVPLFCGKWSCDRCRHILAKQWSWRASLHINASQKQAYFWTLTLRPDVKTAYKGFREIPKNWDGLRKIMQRKTGKWSYLAFVECHPKRQHIPHFHVLSLTAAPVVGTHQRTPLKDVAWSAGFGFSAVEKPVKGGQAASYVAKYASKTDPVMPRNFRRCRASQDWTKLPDKDLPAYLVKARSEHLWQFCLRVADIAMTDPDTILLRYDVAKDLFGLVSQADDL